jgi:hypothetical protein
VENRKWWGSALDGIPNDKFQISEKSPEIPENPGVHEKAARLGIEGSIDAVGRLGVCWQAISVCLYR